MQEKKVHKLGDLQPLFYHITGLVSDEEIFILAHQLNLSLKLSLKQFSTPEVVADKQINNYNAYSSFPDEHRMFYALLANKNEDGILIDKYKNIDYFLISCAETESSTSPLVQKKIREVKQVLAVVPVEITQIKHKLLLDSVLHQFY
jgi:hypothetical protein